MQHVKTGKLVALAISSLERSKFYPELPLIAETYPGFETESWVAMFAPAGTPKPVLEKLHGTLARLLARSGHAGQVRGAGLRPRREHARGARAAHPLRPGQMGKDRPRQEHLGRMKLSGSAPSTCARWNRRASSSPSTARSTRTPRCIRWCAGSSAAASRRRIARRSCSPTSSTPRAAQVRHPGARRRARGQPRDLPPRHRLPARRDQRDAGRARSPIPLAPNVVERRAVPRDRHHRQGARQARHGPRRLPMPISTPGWDIAPLHHALAIHHQGSRHRRAEHGQLSRPGEGAAASSA